jgi:hypothetical protein
MGEKTEIKLFIMSHYFPFNTVFYHIYLQMYHLNFVQMGSVFTINDEENDELFI